MLDPWGGSLDSLERIFTSGEYAPWLATGAARIRFDFPVHIELPSSPQ
jgi:hypothetical protein